MLQQFDDPAVRQSPKMDALVREAVFGNEDARTQARWMLWEIGQRAGVRPASIHELYLARGSTRDGRLPVGRFPRASTAPASWRLRCRTPPRAPAHPSWGFGERRDRRTAAA